MRKTTVLLLVLLACFSMSAVKAAMKDGHHVENDRKYAEIRSSKDDTDYSQNGKAVIKLPGMPRKQTLYVTLDALKESDERNCPVRVGLRVGKNKISFESLWNDGIQVGVADFDKNDQYIDIYINELGTDIGTTTYIYRFDGSTLTKYGMFEHLFTDFCYDGQGRIYYSNSEARQTPDTVFGYQSKKSGRIRDRRLLLELNSFKVSAVCHKPNA